MISVDIKRYWYLSYAHIHNTLFRLLLSVLISIYVFMQDGNNEINNVDDYPVEDLRCKYVRYVRVASVIKHYDTVASWRLLFGSLLTKQRRGIVLIVGCKYPIHPLGKLRRDKVSALSHAESELRNERKREYLIVSAWKIRALVNSMAVFADTRKFNEVHAGSYAR